MIAMQSGVEFNAELATQVITRLVIGNDRKPGLIRKFSNHPEFRVEDLVSEGMIGALRDWHEYDPLKSAPQTFIYQRAYTAIMDLGRNVKSARNKIKRLKMRLTEEHQEGPEVIEPDDMPLAAWIVWFHGQVRKHFNGAEYRKGRKEYKMSQLITIAGMMQRFDMSSRRTVKMLGEREDVREALKLNKVPSHDMLIRAARCLKEFGKQHANSDATSSQPASDQEYKN